MAKLKTLNIPDVRLNILSDTNIISIKAPNIAIFGDVLNIGDNYIEFNSDINKQDIQHKLFFIDYNPEQNYPWYLYRYSNTELEMYKSDKSKYNLFIIESQKRRFAELDKILTSNDKIQVVFPAKYIKSNNWELLLGKGFAIGQYDTLGRDAYSEMIRNLNHLVFILFDKFKTRIHYGVIGEIDYGNPPLSTNELIDANKDYYTYVKPSEEYIHIFGANVLNFNLDSDKKISGSGQAACFSAQKKGIFGIVTTPLALNKDNVMELLADSKY